MQLDIECIPCFFAQIVRAGRMTTDDDNVIRGLLAGLGERLGTLDETCSAPELAATVYADIRALGNGHDPYQEIKRQSTESALSLYPRLREMVLDADDPVEMAVRFAIAGNIIDFGTGSDIDIDAAIAQASRQESGLWEYDRFRRALDDADELLYLGDNAGETVFDRLLIEQLDIPVVYVVRGKPVINDATLDDAYAAGLDKVATVISSGSPAPGTVLALCDDAFVERFWNAPLIISKGQGNFEALSDENAPIFFLLKAKCDVIARRLQVTVGDPVLTAAD